MAVIILIFVIAESAHIVKKLRKNEVMKCPKCKGKMDDLSTHFHCPDCDYDSCYGYPDTDYLLRHPSCKNCKTGLMLLNLYHARKNKELGRVDGLTRMQAIGQKCYCCMYNDMKGLKVRAYKTVVPNFQALDYFEPKE